MLASCLFPFAFSIFCFYSLDSLGRKKKLLGFITTARDIIMTLLLTIPFHSLVTLASVSLFFCYYPWMALKMEEGVPEPSRMGGPSKSWKGERNNLARAPEWPQPADSSSLAALRHISDFWPSDWKAVSCVVLSHWVNGNLLVQALRTSGVFPLSCSTLSHICILCLPSSIIDVMFWLLRSTLPNVFWTSCCLIKDLAYALYALPSFSLC